MVLRSRFFPGAVIAPPFWLAANARRTRREIVENIETIVLFKYRLHFLSNRQVVRVLFDGLQEFLAQTALCGRGVGRVRIDHPSTVAVVIPNGQTPPPSGITRESRWRRPVWKSVSQRGPRALLPSVPSVINIFIICRFFRRRQRFVAFFRASLSASASHERPLLLRGVLRFFRRVGFFHARRSAQVGNWLVFYGRLGAVGGVFRVHSAGKLGPAQAAVVRVVVIVDRVVVFWKRVGFSVSFGGGWFLRTEDPSGKVKVQGYVQI